MSEPNITCRKCRHRHPASRTCAEAKRLADEAAVRRNALSAADEPPSSEVAILRNLLGNLYMAVLRRAEFRGEADLQFAMEEAAQGLGEPYSTATKSGEQS